MNETFDEEGKLIVPLECKIPLPKDKVEEKEGELFIKEAYCPKGHSLLCDTEIEGHRGIHLIYKDPEEGKEWDLIVSPVIGKTLKKIL